MKFNPKYLFTITTILALALIGLLTPDDASSQSGVTIQISNGSPGHGAYTGETQWGIPSESNQGVWQHDLRPSISIPSIPAGNSQLTFDAAPGCVHVHGTTIYRGESINFTYNGATGTVSSSLDGLNWHFEMH